jgi:hypothetical protein
MGLFQPCNSLELLKKAKWSYGCPLLTLRSKTASSGVTKINLAHKARGMEEEEKRSIGSNITFRCFFFVTFSPVRKPVVRWVVDFLEGAGKRVNKAKTTYDTTASTRLKSQQARKSLLLRFCMGDKATGRIAWPCIGCWNEPYLSHTDTHTHTPVYYGCMPCADRISRRRRRRRFFLPVSGTKRGSIVRAFLGGGLVWSCFCFAAVLPSLTLFFRCFIRYVL